MFLSRAGACPPCFYILAAVILTQKLSLIMMVTLLTATNLEAGNYSP